MPVLRLIEVGVVRHPARTTVIDGGPGLSTNSEYGVLLSVDLHFFGRCWGMGIRGFITGGATENKQDHRT